MTAVGVTAVRKMCTLVHLYIGNIMKSLDPIGSQCIGEIVTHLPVFLIYLQSLPDQRRSPQVNLRKPK